MNSFKNTTGLLQEEIALLLGVTRSQWSMYSIGKRGLPVEATLKLHALLQHLQNNDSIKSNRSFLEQENKLSENKLRKKLFDLEFKVYLLDKKIKEIDKNRENLFLAKTSIDFLKTQKNTNTLLFALAEKRIERGLVKNSRKNLEEIQLKKQQLENEIDLIKKVLNSNEF